MCQKIHVYIYWNHPYSPDQLGPTHHLGPRSARSIEQYGAPSASRSKTDSQQPAPESDSSPGDHTSWHWVHRGSFNIFGWVFFNLKVYRALQISSVCLKRYFGASVVLRDIPIGVGIKVASGAFYPHIPPLCIYIYNHIYVYIYIYKYACGTYWSQAC